MKQLILLTVFGLCLAAGIARADDTATEQLLEQLQGVSQLQGQFQQRQYSADSDAVIATTSGNFKLLHPGYFSWELLSPDRQLIIADLSYLWHYDIDLETVTRRPAQGSGQISPLQILGGDAKVLREDFDVSFDTGEGYVLLPLVFAANIAPEAGGSGLLFVSVPVAFGNVIYGVEMTVALYLAVTLLALVSIAALMEPIVVTLNEKLGLHRALAALLTGGFAWLAAIAVAEHFSSDTVLGLPFDINMMALFGLASQYLMPVVALLTVVFLGWVVDQRFLTEELEMFSPILVRFWRILLRWVALPAILLVLALPIYDKIVTSI